MTAIAEPSVDAPSADTDVGTLQRIPLEQLQESPHNPRKRFDPAALEQLKESMLASGQLEPILVRPRLARGATKWPGAFEIAAGHRRFRAAKLACERHVEGARYRGLDQLLAIVRVMDDRTFIETLNVDNLQRDDLHPIEEAAGFKDLMTECGYDVKKIAARIGKSERYVYDSLTLLKLIPEAKKLFLSGEFERGHAIELARLAPEWQTKALDRKINRYQAGRGGLWEAEHFDQDPTLPAQQRLALDDRVKAVSVREFKAWVDDHVRFRPEDADPVLFPETVAAVQMAKDDKIKVVHITHDYRCTDATRDPKLRTYGSEAWKRADGRQGSKHCEHAVIGAVVAGPGRGDAFQVCVAKEKCTVHWAKERERHPLPGRSRTTEDDWRARQRREREAYETEQARWTKARPALLKAVIAKISTAPATGALAEIVLEACLSYGQKVRTDVPRGKTAESFLRHAAFQVVAHIVTHPHGSASEVPPALKPLGIDARKIVDEVAPKESKKPAIPQTTAQPKTRRKAKGGK